MGDLKTRSNLITWLMARGLRGLCHVIVSKAFPQTGEVEDGRRGYPRARGACLV